MAVMIIDFIINLGRKLMDRTTPAQVQCSVPKRNAYIPVPSCGRTAMFYSNTLDSIQWQYALNIVEVLRSWHCSTDLIIPSTATCVDVLSTFFNFDVFGRYMLKSALCVKPYCCVSFKLLFFWCSGIYGWSLCVGHSIINTLIAIYHILYVVNFNIYIMWIFTSVHSYGWHHKDYFIVVGFNLFGCESPCRWWLAKTYSSHIRWNIY